MKATLTIIILLFASGCADLDMDVRLPDVYVNINVDGGIDGGLDVRIDDVELGGNSDFRLVDYQSQAGERARTETISSATPAPLSELPISTP